MNSSPSISPRASTFFSGKVSPGGYSRPTIGVYEITAEKQERLERLRLEFKEMDLNQDDNLTFDEVRDFLRKKSGEDFDEVLCQELFTSMDKDRDSTVSVEEFIMAYVQAEELLRTRIDQLERQVTDNKQHLEEAKWKCEQARKTEKVNQFGVMVGSVLTCHVREAKNLKPMNVRNKSDPYAVLTCERQRIETKYIPNEVNPVWDEVFTFQIEKGDSVLKANIMDRSTIGSDEFQGQVAIELASIADQLKHDKYFELMARDNKAPWQGKIRLGLQWIWSKVKYFEKIIQQWEENLEMDRQEMEYLNGQLAKLDKPFGFIMEQQALQGIQPKRLLEAQMDQLEGIVDVKFEEMLGRVAPKDIDWNWVTFLCIAVFLALSVLVAFARTNFLDVLLAALLCFLWASDSRSAKEYKAISLGLLLSKVVDLIWFFSVATTWTSDAEPGSSLRSFILFLSAISFIVKLPIIAVIWRRSLEFTHSGTLQ